MRKPDTGTSGLSRRSLLKGAAALAVGYGLSGAARAAATKNHEETIMPHPEAEDLTRLVNPLQGTNSVQSFSRGNTLPLVSRPFGMTHWSMQTSEAERWFFEPDKHQLIGVRATHQPSPWMGDYGQFTVMAQAGAPALSASARASAYRPEDLTVLPHALSVLLQRGDVRLEMTPTERCAVFRFTFPKGEAGRVIFDAHSQVILHPERRLIAGFSRLNSGGVPSNFACHFVAVFDQDWRRALPTRAGEIAEGLTMLEGEHIGAMAEFAPPSSGHIVLKIGTSFISTEQALRNLEHEVGGKSFDSLRAEGEAAWNETLGRIRVEGGTDDQRRTFYSCLYRAHLFPRMFHEPGAGGEPIHYSPYDGKVHPGVLYTDNGFWDTYRTVYPLLSLIQPTRLGEIIQGFVNAYKEGGWLPNWPSPGYRACMIGTHIDAVIADAVVKGIGGFDREAAYAGMVKHANTPIEGERGYGRIALREYLDLGYVPADKYDHATARTLDYAYDDFCLAQVAGALDKPEDQAKYRKRALSYQNVYDPATTFMRGKNVDGSWQEPFDSYAWGGPFIEGSAWQFNFTVPHDPTGLTSLMGGPAKVLDKLDRFLYQPPTFHPGTYGGVIHEMAEMAAVDFGQYDQGNQPVHSFLYFYAAAGSPWKTQYWTRRVLDILYTPDSLPGDEDNGEMGAWYVLNALGLGPLCPGVPEYVLVSPLFPTAHLHVAKGKTLRIETTGVSKENAYIQSVSLSGQAHSPLCIGHQSLVEGGHLHLVLGPQPPERRLEPSDLPFSLSAPTAAVAYDGSPIGPIIRINCGGEEIGRFVGDAFVHGGSISHREARVDTSAPHAAPAAIYQTERHGEFSYTLPLPALPAGRTYTLRLHFVEALDEYAGKRRQNVSLNGQKVLQGFDVFTEAGGVNKAIVREFTGLHPSPHGSLVIAFAPAPDSPDRSAQISAIEVEAGG